MMDLDLSPPAPPEKPEPKPDFMVRVFSYINSITNSKTNLMRTEEDEAFYAKARFMILRGLSYHADLLPVINELNKRNLPARQEYELLLSVVEAKPKKPGKWPKKAKASMYLEDVMNHYGYNETRAAEAIKMLTPEQLYMIEQKIRKIDDVHK